MGSHKKPKHSRDHKDDEEIRTSCRDPTVRPEQKTFSESPKRIRESKHKRSKEKKVSEEHEHVSSSSKHSEYKSSSKKRKQESWYPKQSDREYIDRNDVGKYPKQSDRVVDQKDTDRMKIMKQCDREYIDHNDGAKYPKQSDRGVDRKDTDRTKYPKLSDRDDTHLKTKESKELKKNRLNPEVEYEQRDKGDHHRQFERYWGDKPIKKNSDSYWNKYPIEEESREKHEVGPRYYSNKNEDLGKKPTGKGVTDGTLKCDDSKTQKSTESMTTSQKKTVDLLTSKTGGAYIPPAKLRMMQSNITDKTSLAYQRIAWEALKKSIHGHINKVNTGNIAVIVRELFKENIVRGRGLLCRSIIQAQAASPTFTNVYAALVSVINSRFPNIAELLLNRCVIQFRRGFKRNDKATCISAATFIAHLFNQGVAHEILALELLSLLVESPTNDSIEVAIVFLKECGQKLTEVSKKGIDAIFDMLRNILHEGQLEKRVQYMIEVMFQVRKDDFKEYPSLMAELNLVDEEDQFTHLIALDEATDGQDILNVFKFDPEYEETEKKYTALRAVILDEGEGGSETGDSGEEGSEAEGSSEEEEANEEKKELILDNTETNLVALRKTIYLTIHSSLDFEECAHKLLRMELKPGQEVEMCHMFLDCCAEQRTYEKFFGLLAQRFCQINRMYIGPFEQIFRDSYATIYRLETNKLRNVAKFFAHLLFTDAISWDVLATIRLNEEDTSSSSRIFIKILFQELSEYMGLLKLNQRVKDPVMQLALDGLFPRDNPKNTRFAINFFTSIGLGGLTDELREHLKAQPKKSVVVPQLVEALSSSSSTTESSSEESSSESSSDSSSESSDNSSEKKLKKKSSKNNNASRKSKKKSSKSQSSKQKKR